MKKYEFNLSQRDVDSFFKPIRRKEDIFVVLMNSLKQILSHNAYPIPIGNVKGKMVLILSKMSRLFYFTEEKFFSIHFPFTVSEKDDSLLFSSKYIDEIDSEMSSHVLSLLLCNKGESTCITDILEPLTDIENQHFHQDIGTLVRELLFMEDGYIRYDYDEEHENGVMHPLNHFDVNYSSKTTFKIGIDSKTDNNFFLDLMDITTDCQYIR